MAWGEIARSVLGFGVFGAVAWAVAEDKARFSPRLLLLGLLGQIVFALLLTRVPLIVALFGGIAKGVSAIQDSATAGAMFVFGYLGGGPQPFLPAPHASSTFIFALQALPAVFLVSALAALFWHWGVLRWVVRGSAWVFGHLFGVSGPVGVSTSACIFFGMIEAPLLVSPLIPRLSRAEIFIIMVDGLSVIAGSIMILLAAILRPHMPNAFGELLTASLISTPMAIAMARSIVPGPAKGPRERVVLESPYRSSLDAVTHGTFNAVKLVAYIVALLIVFVGSMDLLDRVLALLPHAGAPLSLARIAGVLLAPVAWLMGVPLGDLQTVGGILGTKVTLNEVVAYSQFFALPAGSLAPKSGLILTYALCSFGNIGSVAILIGALSAMAPAKADEVTALGFKALLAAFMTTCLSGSVIGLLSSVLP